jgi:hypothetical protein
MECFLRLQKKLQKGVLNLLEHLNMLVRKIGFGFSSLKADRGLVTPSAFPLRVRRLKFRLPGYILGQLNVPHTQSFDNIFFSDSNNTNLWFVTLFHSIAYTQARCCMHLSSYT